MRHKSIFKSQFSIFSFAVVIIPVLLAYTYARAGALPRIARLIPTETVFLVKIEDFGQLKGQFEKTDLYKFYKDPAMAAFIDDASGKWREKIKQERDDIIKAIVDADILPQGRVAIAIGKKKGAGPMPILFISQWGENTAKIKEAIDKIVKKAVEDGAYRKAEDYRGVSVVSMIKELDLGNTPQPTTEKTYYCFIDDCLVVSTDLDTLKFVIAHIKGAGSPALAGDANYTATMKATGPYHDIDFYVNIEQIIKTIITEDSTGQIQTKISNMGLDNVTAFGCSLGVARYRGSSYCGKGFLKVNGTKKGICKMLDVESAVLKAPRFIPASACSVIFLNLNIKKAYNELYNILYGFSPMYAAMMHSLDLPPGPDGEPGLELKRDIIDHLGSQIVIAQSINKPFSPDSAPTESLFALAINNSKALEKALSLLHSKFIAQANPNARRELLGHTIYLINISGLLPPFLPRGNTPMTASVNQDAGLPSCDLFQTASHPSSSSAMAFTVTDTHLILGLESVVEKTIRTLRSKGAISVGSAKWFNNAKSAVASTVGLAGLEDDVASGELFWWMVKQGDDKAKTSNTSASPASFKFAPQIFDKFINPSLLPSFDAVRKYFGLSAFYGVSRSDGFFFEFKDINPDATGS